MGKKSLFITLAVTVIIAAIAYIAGSLNSNNDTVDASKTVDGISTYTNSEIGFEFAHPKDYSLLEEKDNLPAGNVINIYVARSNQTGESVGVSVYKKFRDKDLEQFLLEQKDSGVILLGSLLTSGDFSSNQKTIIEIANTNAVQYQENVELKRTSFIEFKDYLVLVYEQTSFGENNIYDQVLESFDLTQ